MDRKTPKKVDRKRFVRYKEGAETYSIRTDEISSLIYGIILEKWYPSIYNLIWLAMTNARKRWDYASKRDSHNNRHMRVNKLMELDQHIEDNKRIKAIHEIEKKRVEYKNRKAL